MDSSLFIQVCSTPAFEMLQNPYQVMLQLAKLTPGMKAEALINQSINQFISRHTTEARATMRFC